MTKRRRFYTFILAAAATAVALIAFLSRASVELYRVTTLPSLGGGFVFADAINDRGQVVGTSSVPGGTHHLFLWDRSQGIRDLGPIDGPADINREGQICATATDPNGRRCAFILDPDGTRRWLGALGGSTSIAMAINNRGQVVGESWTAGDINHAFLWDCVHGMRDLGPSDTTQSCALAVNDSGRVVVYSPQRGVFLWDPNDGLLLVSTPIPNARFGFGEINNKGHVALPCRQSAGTSRLMLLNGAATGRTLLDVDGDVTDVWLNDADQVLFTRSARRFRIPLLNRLFADRRAQSYLWDPTMGLVSLGTYVPPGTNMRLAVRDLNNEGCIVGFLFDAPAGNRSCAILLEPISERWGK